MPQISKELVYIRKHSALLAFSVLIAYFYIAQSSIRNKHTHFYPNGVIITHSHPVDHSKGNPIQKHGHTKAEICFFSTLQFDFFDTLQSEDIDFEQTEDQFDFQIAEVTFYLSEYSFAETPRGPPV